MGFVLDEPSLVASQGIRTDLLVLSIGGGLFPFT